jgi:hypothetical protein
MTWNKEARSTPGGASKHKTDEIGLLWMPIKDSKKIWSAVRSRALVPMRSQRRNWGALKEAVREYNGRARHVWALIRNHFCSTDKPTEWKYRGAARSLERQDTCVINRRSLTGRCTKIIKTSSFGKGQYELIRGMIARPLKDAIEADVPCKR